MEKEIELIATMTVLSSIAGNEPLVKQDVVWKGGESGGRRRNKCL